MQQPLQITIKDIDHSPAIEQEIRAKIEKLEHYADDIISCHVVVELTQKHQQQGQLHNLHIRLTVPGKELVATRNAHENLWIAIKEASDDMRDQLRRYTEQRRKQVKNHPDVLQGEIARLFEDFGFILGPDGLTEYYFNDSNVTHSNFSRLSVGTKVHFIEGMGDEGPQARRVSVIEDH